MRIRLSRTRSILLAAVAVLLALDTAYLIVKTRPEPAEASIYLWSVPVVADIGGKWGPSVAADGSWINGDGRRVDIRKSVEHQSWGAEGGPASLTRISLGADPSYGHFLKSLHALARARTCTYAIAAKDPADGAGRDSLVQSVVDVRDPETGIVTSCMPVPSFRLG